MPFVNKLYLVAVTHPIPSNGSVLINWFLYCYSITQFTATSRWPGIAHMFPVKTLLLQFKDVVIVKLQTIKTACLHESPLRMTSFFLHWSLVFSSSKIVPSLVDTAVHTGSTRWHRCQRSYEFYVFISKASSHWFIIQSLSIIDPGNWWRTLD